MGCLKFIAACLLYSVWMVFAVLWVLPLIHPDIQTADKWTMALGVIVMFGPPVLFLLIYRVASWTKQSSSNQSAGDSGGD